MPAVHPFQNPVIERLHSHTDTVEAQAFQSVQPITGIRADIIRIDLYRSLHKPRQVEIVRKADHHPSEHFQREK